MSSMIPSFASLLEQSRQLTNHISSKESSIGVLDRGLDQIESQTKRLLKRNLQQGEPSSAGFPSTGDRDRRIGPVDIDARTAYLLAKRGFDLQTVSSTLDQINLSHTFEPLDGVVENDIESYLMNEHENMISLVIQESKDQCVADFEKNVHLSVKSEWDRLKRKIFEDLGQDRGNSLTTKSAAKADRWDALSISGMGRDKVTKVAGNTRSKAYASMTESFNKSRLRGTDFNLFKQYSMATDSFNLDQQQKSVHLCWDLLSLIAKHARDLPKTPSLIDSPEFRIATVAGGLEWLERIYRSWVGTYVRDNHVEIGGMPTVHNEVESILKIQYYQSGRWSLPWLDLSIGKKPFWAHVLTLVRMGLKKDAVEYVRSYQNELNDSNENKNFPAYFKAWCDSPDGRLPKSLRDSLLTEWNSSIRDYVTDANGTPRGDVFKYTLYKLMGRCEMNVKAIRCPDILNSTEDYLWFNMMLVQESSLADSSYDVYTLRDFSRLMQKYGLNHFKQTALWFRILLLCGEFELAIDDLFRDNFFSIDAVHFAIALAANGFLRVPENPRIAQVSGTFLSKKVVSLGKGVSYNVCYLHFARLIISFVRDVVSSDVERLNYLYLIGLYGEPLEKTSGLGMNVQEEESRREYTRVAQKNVRDVVISSGNYAMLLGQVRADGSGRVPGHIDTFKSLIHISSDAEFLETMVLSCARDAQTQARIEDAIQLYHLGGQYSRVIEILSQYLGDKLLQYGFADNFTSSGSSTFDATSTDANLPIVSLEKDPVDAASQLLKFYMSKPLTSSAISRRAASTLDTLIQLFRFRTQIDLNRDEAALTILYPLGILPETVQMAEIQMKADAFKDLDEVVSRIIPNIMVLGMQALYNIYRSWSYKKGELGVGGSTGSGVREARVKEVRERAKALSLFAGMIQNRFPGDVYAKLNRIDVLMG